MTTANRTLRVTDFTLDIDAAMCSAEPYRSARLSLLACKLRSIAWRAPFRDAAREEAERAERAISSEVDLLAGQWGETGLPPALHAVGAGVIVTRTRSMATTSFQVPAGTTEPP